MKLTSNFLSATAILLSVNVYAQQRSESEMAQIASEFLTPKATRAAVQMKAVEVTPELSIYTRAGGGWVIVSGDERTRGAILAYSNEGQFDLESETLREWIGNYREQIRSLANVRADVGATEPGTPVVGPLITTKWDQVLPYYFNTPTYTYDYSGHDIDLHCYTGCVATTIAQIMNYWQWPKRGQGKHTDKNYPSATVDFSQSEYDWDNMLDEYIFSSNEIIYDNDSNIVKINSYGNWTDEQTGAVAKLMYDCGVALDSQYREDGTSSYSENIPKAICLYFDYSTDAMSLERDRYQGDWDALLRSELDAGRPMCYSGTDSSYDVGHSFVCDGYDDQGYFHFNFGWSGNSDGYYLTSVITPPDYDFSFGQHIVYGIHPAGQDDKVIYSDGLYYRRSDDGFMLLSADNIGLDGHVIIPDKINDIPVTSIADNACFENKNLKSLEIGNYVKTIGNLAFASCSFLDTVIIGKSVQSIGEFAFTETALLDLVIPSSVEVIDLAAFQLCTSLKSVVMTDVKTIGDYAFCNCNSLDSVTFGSSVERIGKNGFLRTKIRNLALPASIIELGDYSFGHCEDLMAITSFGSLSVIGECSFAWCYNLKSMTFPESLSVIGEGAFTVCSSLENVDIPNSVEAIGFAAFDDCASLKSVVIGSGVKTIGGAAFAENPKLTSVTCLATTPPACDESQYEVFMETDISKAALYVPKGSMMTYQLANPWNGFGTFNEIIPTGVEVPEFAKPTDEYYLNSHIKILDGKKYLLPGSGQ